MPLFTHPIDLNNLELLNFLIQNLSTSPTGIAGKVYFDTTSNSFLGYNGTEWKSFINDDDDFINLPEITTSENVDYILIYDTSSGGYRRISKNNFIAGTGGEANTGSNVGVDGVGVFNGKVGVDLQFRNIAPASNMVSVVSNINDIDLDVVPSNIDHNALLNYSVSEHRTINDAGTGTTDLWSADKINTDLAGKADVSHTHSHTEITDFDAGVRTNRLDQMASPTLDINMNGRKIVSLANGSADTDAVNKSQLDAMTTGLDIKKSVRVATTTNITLSGSQTIDGILADIGVRVLVKDQTSSEFNGIYIVQVGSWIRADDFDSSAKVTPGAFCFVEEGTVNADTGWVLTTDEVITLGTTSLTFEQFSSTGQIIAGDALAKTGNILDVVPYTGTGANRGQTVIDTDSIAVILGTGANEAAAGNHNHLLTNLTDITLTPPAENDILAYDDIGGYWENRSLAEAGIQAVITGAATSITSSDLTINRALLSDASGKVAVSSVTDTELGYLSGVSSAIQTQLDSKPTKYAQSVGDGTNTSFVINHNLNSRDVTVIIYESASPYEQIFTNVEMTDLNNVTVSFAVAPLTNEYRVVVTG